MYRKQSYLDLNVRKVLANAIIQPHFDYACASWFSGLNVKLKKQLQISQNKVIRFCLKLDARAHIGTNHFKKLNLLPIEDRNKQICLTHVYKFVNGLSPSYMSELLHIAVVNENKCTTRQSKKKNALVLPHVEKGIKHNSFRYLAPYMWNELPNNITGSENVYKFKCDLKKYLYCNLASLEECNYIFSTNFKKINML